MAIKYTIEKHASCFPSLMLAQNGGKHIYSVQLDKDTDNGSIVAKGDWKGQQYYGVKDSTGVEGIVLEQAANGNWYVEITAAGDGLLIYQVPLIEEQWTKEFQKEGNFYNLNGDIVRAYELAAGDIIECSAECFDKTPSAKKKLTVENRKFKLGSE